MYVHDKEYEEQQQGNNINSKENRNKFSSFFFPRFLISDILLFGEVLLCLTTAISIIPSIYTCSYNRLHSMPHIYTFTPYFRFALSEKLSLCLVRILLLRLVPDFLVPVKVIGMVRVTQTI